jgi:hypothetical protein
MARNPYFGNVRGPNDFDDPPLVFFDDFITGGATVTGTSAGGKFSDVANRAEWLVTDDAAATIVISDDEIGGVLSVTTGSSGNDFCSLQLNGEAFKIQVGKQCEFQCKMKLDDSDDTRWFIGLATTDTTGTSVGPILDGTTESIGFRQNTDTGQDVYYVCEDNSTETTADTAVDVADDTYNTFYWYYDGRSTIRFYIDGVKVGESTTNIPYDDAVTPTIEVHSPTASSKMEVDYILVRQER